MAQNKRCKFTQNNPDFQWHFRRLFMAILVVGNIELYQQIRRQKEKAVRRGAITDFNLPMPAIMLPTVGRKRGGLYTVLDQMIKADCFPKWFRERTYVEQRWDGPYSEDLESALRVTAFTAHEGKFIANFMTETEFQLVLQYDSALEILDYYEIALGSAKRWGRTLFRLWNSCKQ